MSISFTEKATELEFRLVDAYNHTTSHSLKFPEMSTRADLTTYADLYIPVLDGVSHAGVIDYRFHYRRYVQDAFSVSGSDAYNMGTIIMEDANGGLWSTEMPSVNPAIVLPDGFTFDIGTLETFLINNCCVNDLAATRLVALKRAFRQSGGQYV